MSKINDEPVEADRYKCKKPTINLYLPSDFQQEIKIIPILIKPNVADEKARITREFREFHTRTN